jgi:alpha-L-fucosidase
MPVVVRGLRNQVLKAYVLGTGTELDPLCTVIALELDGEVSVHRPHEA